MRGLVTVTFSRPLDPPAFSGPNVKWPRLSANQNPSTRHKPGASTLSLPCRRGWQERCPCVWAGIPNTVLNFLVIFVRSERREGSEKPLLGHLANVR